MREAVRIRSDCVVLCNKHPVRPGLINKKHIIMLMDTKGQKFKYGRRRLACLCPVVSEPQLGETRISEGGPEQLELASLLTCLVPRLR